MLLHLIKLVWNRRRANLLLMLEFAVTFLVLFAVATMALFYADNYRHPLGFAYETVWHVAIDMKLGTDDLYTPEMVQGFLQLYHAATSLDEVEAVAGMYAAPYTFSGSHGGFSHDGRQIEFERNEVTDALPQVLGLAVTRGRWFDRRDDADTTFLVVINERMAREAFGDEDPVGQTFRTGWPNPPRVVGVVRAFKKDGEFSQEQNYLFTRKNVFNLEGRPPRNLVVRVRPGAMTGAFEQKLADRLAATVRQWSYDVRPMSRVRASSLRLRMVPLYLFSGIAVFFMLMVGMGLMGVLWQNVTRRRSEIGLRRALGGTVRDIYVQVIGELLVVAAFGAAAGGVVAVQFPLLGLVGAVGAGVYAAGFALALVLLFGLTLLCSLYPSLLATRTAPATALHEA